MAWLQKRLQALGYPDASFDITDTTHIQTLVAWLEDTHIRQYVVSERDALRSMDDHWLLACQQYLTQLGFPNKIQVGTGITTQEWLVVVDWLVAHAISLMYRDNVDSINSNARTQLENKQITKVPVDSSEYTSDQFRSNIITLTKLLNIPMHDDPAVLLNTLQKAIKSKFSGVAITTSSTSEHTLQNDTSISDEKFPLGFNTGEKQIDVASTILRLLYIKDLRELQTNINNLIVEVQSFTTNPQTNTTLGKVGH